MLSCSLGLRQPKLDANTRAFFREAQPWSFILFREACVSRAQVAALCAELREAVGRDAIVYIDQEGGRVARLKPPEWPTWPAPAVYGSLYETDAALGVEAARLGYRLIAHELRAIGVNGDFAPVLDTEIAGASAVVGDRALSTNTVAIIALGTAVLEGLHAGGVTGCIKHAPGHGRAEVDTHFELPKVSASEAELGSDIAPFVALAGVEAAMTAHIIYQAWDAELPATCSPTVIANIIRGRLGFDGLLMTDDLDMQALFHAFKSGLADRAARALAAGCDVVLQCTGKLDDMINVANGCRALEGRSLARAEAVEAIAKRQPEAFDADAGWARFRELLRGAL